MATIDILGLDEVLIDTPILIRSDEERTFENQRLRLAADIQVDGKLTFKNCYITISDAHIRASGQISFHNCDVRDIKGVFLVLSDTASALLDNSFFVITKLANSARNCIYAPVDAAFEIKNGLFKFEPISLPHLLPAIRQLLPGANCTTLPRKMIRCLATIVNAKSGKLTGCSFHDFPCPTLAAREIFACTFKNCAQIECIGSDDKGSLRLNTFVGCGQVDVSDAPVTACEFDQLQEQLHVINSDIKNCTFKNIQCSNDALIILEDGIISHSTFNGIELTNDAYLVEAFGDAAVEESHFTNCSTSRDDLELVHCGEMRGTLFKRYKESDIIDHTTCTGLDDVMHIDNNPI